MKITDRGFWVTDLSIPGLKGIDVSTDAGSKSIGIVGEPGQTILVFTLEQWREFSAAVTAVNERLNISPASDTRAVIIDGDGDEWTPIPNTDLYSHDDMRYTRDRIESLHGIREG